MARGMSQQFGFGLGRVLLRAVAAYADNDSTAAAITAQEQDSLFGLFVFTADSKHFPFLPSF